MRKEHEPPKYLLGKIVSRIQKERQFLVMRNRLIILSLGIVSSFIAFIPAFNALKTDILQSGIMNFLSLLFYDSVAVMAVWQDFALSILESLPVISIIIFCAVIFVFLLSVKILMHDISNVFNIFKKHPLIHNHRNYGLK